jgi:hypothetical protein
MTARRLCECKCSDDTQTGTACGVRPADERRDVHVRSLMHAVNVIVAGESCLHRNHMTKPGEADLKSHFSDLH